MNANAYFLGKIDDDIESGQLKITITLQAFNGEELVKKSIELLRGKRLDPEDRKLSMQQLAEDICNKIIATPPKILPLPTTSQSKSMEAFSPDELKELFISKGLRESEWNSNGDYPNEFEIQTQNGETVVIDRATNLMWQRSGSSNEVLLKDTGSYIRELNTSKFAGFSDWSLPTIQELATLIGPANKIDLLHIDSIFNAYPEYWSSTKVKGLDANWYVSFDLGMVRTLSSEGRKHILAVRSIR